MYDSARREKLDNDPAHQMRRAVAYVEDIDTYKVACDKIHNKQIPIDSKSKNTGKTALNFAIEFLCNHLLQQKHIRINTVFFKLKIIETVLLAYFQADIVPKPKSRPDTENAIQQIMNEKCKLLNELAKQSATQNQRIIYAACLVFENMLNTLKTIIEQKNLLQVELNLGSFAEITTKPIIVNMPKQTGAMDAYLEKIQPFMQKHPTICIDAALNTDKNKEPEDGNIAQLLQYIHKPELRYELVFIDPQDDNKLLNINDFKLQFPLHELRTYGKIYAIFHEFLHKKGQIMIFADETLSESIHRAFQAQGVSPTNLYPKNLKQKAAPLDSQVVKKRMKI